MNKDSKWIGKINDRMQLKVVLYKITSYMFYGCIYVFKDSENNILVWMTKKEMSEWTEGQEMEIKFTIKEHIYYKNSDDSDYEKQTSITRVKTT